MTPIPDPAYGGAARAGPPGTGKRAMNDITLVIGNRNYSSWSMRAWLVLTVAGLTFTEKVIPLDEAGTHDRIREHSAAGLVPVLHHGDTTVWDSLAISEYVAELCPGAGLWPEDAAVRAVARAVSAEMHAGFAELRARMPMNVRARTSMEADGPELAVEIARIREIWRRCREDFGAGGEYLFGGFTIADAMYAPVVSRFRTYGVALDGRARAYADAVWDHPAVAGWAAGAEAEPQVIAKYAR
jgi:glutathione S-transferase